MESLHWSRRCYYEPSSSFVSRDEASYAESTAGSRFASWWPPRNSKHARRAEGEVNCFTHMQGWMLKEGSSLLASTGYVVSDDDTKLLLVYVRSSRLVTGHI